VLGSGLIIAFLVTHQYSAALRRAMFSQAENLAHSVALDAADKVLLNDLVALQKMLDQQTQSNPLLAYIFVMRDGQVLAHTFERGVPVQLLEANGIGGNHQPRFKEIVSQRGEAFLDTAWPIYDGKAGIHMGFSKSLYQRQKPG
jgi:two-component system response regulator HydG